MKLSLMRPALVLALALGLASCGGKAGFSIAGEVSGLKYSGLKLSTNGMSIDVAPPAPTATGTVKFEFPNQIEYGEVYDVKITNPEHQVCVTDHTGTNTAGRLTAINVMISCAIKTNKVSGTVTGLKATGLQLTNGSTSGIVTVAPTGTDADATFSFTGIPYGQAYGITVYANPTNQVCTVGPTGSGYMLDDEKGVSGIVVTCT